MATDAIYAQPVIEEKMEEPIHQSDEEEKIGLQNPTKLDAPKKAQLKAVKAKPLEIIEFNIERFIEEMHSAHTNDLEAYRAGRPALHKLQSVDKVVSTLKNEALAKAFLDKGGLEQLYQYIKRLPDGSLPLSSIRRAVLEVLVDLPYEGSHLKSTKIGRFGLKVGKAMNYLYHSDKEYPENKRLIEQVRARWNRMAVGGGVEYKELETIEQANRELMRNRQKRVTSNNFAPLEQENLQESSSLSAKVKMGYNFTIRPKSELSKRDLSKSQEPKKSDISKHLNQMRKLLKQK